MKGLNVGAIAGTSATILLTLNVLPVQANGIVPAADGTGTQVTPNGTDHSITGGTTSADNQNLFHRFTEFNLLTGESATFITDPAILNVLSGVTGSNPSIINGLLQVSGSSANLFLINPNGILFGPDAALNLQGSFTAATADQVNFATGAFGSVGSSDYAALVGDPQSFSFSLDNPGSVVNLGSLNVLPGESVVLLGGQVLNLGTIAAPGGEIVISAVAGGNLVRIVQEGSLLNLEVETLGANVTEPTAFSPLTLPALLTGSAIAPADTVVVNPDGSVQLASGALVSPEAGATTVSGAIEVSGAPGGQILVLGNDIALTDTLLDASGTGGGRSGAHRRRLSRTGIAPPRPNAAHGCRQQDSGGCPRPGGWGTGDSLGRWRHSLSGLYQCPGGDPTAATVASSKRRVASPLRWMGGWRSRPPQRARRAPGC